MVSVNAKPDVSFPFDYVIADPDVVILSLVENVLVDMGKGCCELNSDITHSGSL